MPWKETGPVLERTRFIEDYLSGLFTITELTARYNVSRRTLHKWLARHDRGAIRWKNSKLFLSHTLLGEMVGLEEIDDGVWSLYYSSVLLARFDERDRRFYG
ncbi:MAG: hypothetical protein M3P29_04925 [Acidobacteriota bacterium]|nr:hypothetical protein [Acidobacteriota bacterium]